MVGEILQFVVGADTERRSDPMFSYGPIVGRTASYCSMTIRLSGVPPNIADQIMREICDYGMPQGSARVTTPAMVIRELPSAPLPPPKIEPPAPPKEKTRFELLEVDEDQGE